MARKKGSVAIGSRIRSAFIMACKVLDDENGKKVQRYDKGKRYYAPRLGLTELMIKSLEEDFTATLNAIARYEPKTTKVEGKVTHDHEHSSIDIQETLGRLHGVVEDAIVRDPDSPPKKPMLN